MEVKDSANHSGETVDISIFGRNIHIADGEDNQFSASIVDTLIESYKYFADDDSQEAVAYFSETVNALHIAARVAKELLEELKQRKGVGRLTNAEPTAPV